MDYKKLSLVLVILALAVSLYLIKISNQNPTPSPTALVQTPIPQSFVTSENIQKDLELLKSKQVLTLPEYSLSQEIKFEQLPQEIKFLSDRDAVDIIANKINFSDKKTGFKISHRTKLSLIDSHFSLLIRVKETENYGWTLLKGARADIASLLDLENKTYQAKIEKIYVNNLESRSDIIVIKK